MKKFYVLSLIYLVIGLALGVFFKEFTKMNDFVGITMLSGVHSHALTLGSFLFIGVLVLDKLFNISNVRSFKLWIWIYNISLVGVLATMTARGIYDVTGVANEMITHFAGLFHMTLGISLVWFVIMIGKSIKK